MYFSRVSSRCLIFILWFCLCFLGQASSRKCYVCESSINETCYTNVKNGSFQFDCAEIFKESPKSIVESSQYLQDLIKKYSKEYRAESNVDFNCTTFIGQPLDKEVVRMCVPITENCNTTEGHLRTSGFLTDFCESCDGDLCNTYPQEKPPKPVKKYKEVESMKVEVHAKAMKSDAQRVGLSCATMFLVPIFLRLY